MNELSEVCFLLASSVVAGSDIPCDAASRIQSLFPSLEALRCFVFSVVAAVSAATTLLFLVPHTAPAVGRLGSCDAPGPTHVSGAEHSAAGLPDC